MYTFRKPINSDRCYGIMQTVASNNDPYFDLCAAIIEKACDDYMLYRIKYEHLTGKKTLSKGYIEAKRHYNSAVKFLDDNCPEYQLYSQGVSASYLIEKMYKIIKEKKGEEKR